MTNRIILKNSIVSGVVPTSAQLEIGELALNSADGKLFTKDITNNVISLTDYVDLSNNQNISGLKNFTEGIGVGTTTPGSTLQVTGGVVISSTSSAKEDPGLGGLFVDNYIETPRIYTSSLRTTSKYGSSGLYSESLGFTIFDTFEYKNTQTFVPLSAKTAIKFNIPSYEESSVAEILLFLAKTDLSYISNDNIIANIYPSYYDNSTSTYLNYPNLGIEQSLPHYINIKEINQNIGGGGIVFGLRFKVYFYRLRFTEAPYWLVLNVPEEAVGKIVIKVDEDIYQGEYLEFNNSREVWESKENKQAVIRVRSGQGGPAASLNSTYNYALVTKGDVNLISGVSITDLEYAVTSPRIPSGDLYVKNNLTLGIPLSCSNGGTGLNSSGEIGNVLTSDGTKWVSSPLSIYSKAQVDNKLTNYVDLSSNQTIGGNKTFNSSVVINAPSVPNRDAYPSQFELRDSSTGITKVQLAYDNNQYASTRFQLISPNGQQYTRWDVGDYGSQLGSSNSLSFFCFNGQMSFLSSYADFTITQNTVYVRGSHSDSVKLMINGAEGQTANLTEWRTNTNSPLGCVSANGSFGIGTINPGAKLQVSGGVAVTSTNITSIDPGPGNVLISGKLSVGDKLGTWTGLGAIDSLTNNGYTKLPGGLLMQWGNLTNTIDSNGEALFNFPISFNNIYSVNITNADSNINGEKVYSVNTWNTNTFKVRLYPIPSEGSIIKINFIAIGT